MILLETEMIHHLELDTNDVLSFLVASLAHDFKHPGQTNSYHLNKQTELALLYNDRSILENYHVSETFKVLSDPNNNIFSKFGKSEVRLMRKRIIDMILATDMSSHTKQFTSLKLKLEVQNMEKNRANIFFKEVDTPSAKFDAQQEILNYTLHAADLSHNTKTFKITKKWTDLIMNEFWDQGDLEKKGGLPVSFNCDRVDANVPEGQIGFINGIIIPTFKLLVIMFPQLEYFVINAQKNVEEWNKLLCD
jgi:calcium/calmodulin-dependent 3',5'-cyclic nucleotide phosphodiesterase